MYYYIGKIIFYNPQEIFFTPFYRMIRQDNSQKVRSRRDIRRPVSQRKGFFADNPVFRIENGQAR